MKQCFLKVSLLTLLFILISIVTASCDEDDGNSADTSPYTEEDTSSESSSVQESDSPSDSNSENDTSFGDDSELDTAPKGCFTAYPFESMCIDFVGFPDGVAQSVCESMQATFSPEPCPSNWLGACQIVDDIYDGAYEVWYQYVAEEDGIDLIAVAKDSCADSNGDWIWPN